MQLEEEEERERNSIPTFIDYSEHYYARIVSH